MITKAERKTLEKALGILSAAAVRAVDEEAKARELLAGLEDERRLSRNTVKRLLRLENARLAKEKATTAANCLCDTRNGVREVLRLADLMGKAVQA